jgi:hypothetical protein
MTDAGRPGRRFPPFPVRDVRIRHQKINCAPHFADITVDFEPAENDRDFTFVVAPDLTVCYEPAEDLPRFFAAAAAGIEEFLRDPEYGAGIDPAVKVTLRAARADTFGSHERAFRIAGWLAAREALRRAAGGG